MDQLINPKDMSPLAKKIALALISYEMDEPHIPWPGCPDSIQREIDIYPEMSWKDVIKYVEEPHHGDCIDAPGPCMRCFIETILHKATFISTRLR